MLADTNFNHYNNDISTMFKTNQHYNQSIFDKVLSEIFCLVRVCISYNYKFDFCYSQ